MPKTLPQRQQVQSLANADHSETDQNHSFGALGRVEFLYADTQYND
jgi:hypothetical protein